MAGEWKKAKVRPGCVVDDDGNWRIHCFQGYVDGWAAVQMVLDFRLKEDSEDSCDRKIQMTQTPTSVWLRQLQQRGWPKRSGCSGSNHQWVQMLSPFFPFQIFPFSLLCNFPIAGRIAGESPNNRVCGFPQNSSLSSL